MIACLQYSKQLTQSHPRVMENIFSDMYYNLSNSDNLTCNKFQMITFITITFDLRN